MASPPPTTDLAALREQIDAIDRDLLAALNRRAAVAARVGDLKRHDHTPVFRPEREAQVIAGLEARNDGPLKRESIAAIWREIMSACRALETSTRVAYLGPAGTFSEQAALNYFGSSIEPLVCASIDEVFRATAAASADYGVVPIENSTEGVVTRSLDLLLSSTLTIIGELSLKVQHHLLHKQAGTDGIGTVCAHPQALAQCQGWLSQHLPNAERRAVSSNAEGARMAATDSSIAAIAGERAASLWGLHVVHRSIQDDVHNRTRFAVVADPAKHPAPAASGRDCTSLVASVPNVPGAVHDMLTPLKQHGVSMSRIESRPARSGQWEYYFYIDLQGHPDQPHVAAALRELEGRCAFLRVLGTYPVAG
jgi:chorismate mutase/prephenate dehydratase